MIAIWGEKWSKNLQEIDTPAYQLALQEWSTATQDLTDEHFKEGLESAKMTLDYPPSIAQFRTLAMGLLDSEEAYELILLMREEESRNSTWGRDKTEKYISKVNSPELKYVVVKNAYKACSSVFNRDIPSSQQRITFYSAYKAEKSYILKGIVNYLRGNYDKEKQN